MRFVGLYSKIYQVQGLILGTCLICAGAVAGEKHDYLAMVGPAPLRFQAATVQYDPGNVLPPLKMSDTPATNVVETVTKPAQVLVPTPETTPVLPEHTTPPELPTRPPVESTVPTPPSAASSETRPDSQMTPQMLLRYFSKDGSREVLVPTGVEFTPPPPSSGRSSATYSSPPAR
jgi:hypothetical protein